MSDVDAIRYLASEHDLEFVDLDSYAVDDSAADILPEAIARRHHVVAVKRKFGTPVIAIANPDDVFALDTLRASVGRDFISVVASREQIGTVLDRFYGVPEGSVASEAAAIVEASPVDLPPLTVEVESIEDDESEPVVDDETLGLSLYGSAFLPSKVPATEEQPPEVELQTIETSPFEPLPDAPAANGNGGHAVVEESAEVEPYPDDEGDPPWQDLMESPARVETPSETLSVGAFPADDPLVDLEPVQAPSDNLSSMLPSFDTTDPSATDVEGVPAMPDLGPASEMLTASADELAEFARSVDIPLLSDGMDSVSATADLVEEAVASFEEQHLDSEIDPDFASTMPPLAKALVEGGTGSAG